MRRISRDPFAPQSNVFFSSQPAPKPSRPDHHKIVPSLFSNPITSKDIASNPLSNNLSNFHLAAPPPSYDSLAKLSPYKANSFNYPPMGEANPLSIPSTRDGIQPPPPAMMDLKPIRHPANFGLPFDVQPYKNTTNNIMDPMGTAFPSYGPLGSRPRSMMSLPHTVHPPGFSLPSNFNPYRTPSNNIEPMGATLPMKSPSSSGPTPLLSGQSVKSSKSAAVSAMGPEAAIAQQISNAATSSINDSFGYFANKKAAQEFAADSRSRTPGSNIAAQARLANNNTQTNRGGLFRAIGSAFLGPVGALVGHGLSKIGDHSQDITNTNTLSTTHGMVDPTRMPYLGSDTHF